jgi:predicted enzyme related to lactoylglutathione lyase
MLYHITEVVPPGQRDRICLFDVGNVLSHSLWQQEILMTIKEKMTSLGPPVPELPVADVERAQRHYRDALGFEIGWLYPGKEIGAVSRDRAVIFFRKKDVPFEPAVHWVFAEDIDASYEELQSLGANIVEPLERKPWGLRQFTVKDLDGNIFYFHHD